MSIRINQLLKIFSLLEGYVLRSVKLKEREEDKGDEVFFSLIEKAPFHYSRLGTPNSLLLELLFSTWQHPDRTEVPTY